MRTILSVTLALAMIFIFTACGSELLTLREMNNL